MKMTIIVMMIVIFIIASVIIVAGGGSSIQDESDELIEEKGRLDEGDVEVTGAGAMPCSHVLHAVGPIWKGGHQGMCA